MLPAVLLVALWRSASTWSRCAPLPWPNPWERTQPGVGAHAWTAPRCASGHQAAQYPAQRTRSIAIHRRDGLPSPSPVAPASGEVVQGAALLLLAGDPLREHGVVGVRYDRHPGQDCACGAADAGRRARLRPLSADTVRALHGGFRR